MDGAGHVARLRLQMGDVGAGHHTEGVRARSSHAAPRRGEHRPAGHQRSSGRASSRKAGRSPPRRRRGTNPAQTAKARRAPAAAAGARGIVIAGVGNGNLTQSAVKALATQSQKGIVCVRASRVATGIVGRNVELDDDKLGFVASLDKNPQKARVLLRLALLQKRSLADVQRIFDDY